MSKKKGNCNIMTTEPVDYGLYVILSRELNLWSTHNWSTSSFNLQRLRYKLSFTLSHCRYKLISPVSTRPLISTSSFWREALRVADYLQTNTFLDLVVVEQEECPHALQKKTTRGATKKVVRETAGRTRSGLTLGMSTSASAIHHTTRWVGVTAK